ncbi:MAG: UDP-N-acetylmuramate--alanine ligase [Lentisphaerae bacterium]|nr:UDP-N-acetylmuramate--alanine ligase [Lentisphaerota bacterium]
MLRPGHYHLVGAAGVGMSALAQSLAGAGLTVTGSDRYLDRGDNLPVIEHLRRAGVGFCVQDGSAVTRDTRAVVLSTAIEPDNPDVLAAESQGVPCVHRSVMLANLVAGRRCIAVTGTSGKSTVTGMIGWILDVAGLDPLVVNGAPVLNWADATRIGNYRHGESGLCVIEADESDRSLLNYTPDWGVITNASRDHFGLDETLELFEAFRARVRVGLVSTLHEPRLLEEAVLDVESSGVHIQWGDLDASVPLLGRHNAENALVAAVLCMRLGIEPDVIREALASFRGIARRLERVGTARGVLVVDDYAHNPAKIQATWQALAPHARHLTAIWRPHGFGPLRLMMDDLVETFGAAARPGDQIIVLPVYDVGGTADRSVGAGALVAKLRERGIPAVGVDDVQVLPDIVASRVMAGDVVVTMGARDPHLTDLARAILARIASARG